MRAANTYRGARRNEYRAQEPSLIREWRKGPWFRIVRKVRRWVMAPDPLSKTTPPALSRQFLLTTRAQFVHRSLEPVKK